MQPKIFFLMNSIDTKRGGITQACLKQAATFADLGFDTTILTFNFNPRYPFIKKELLKANKLHKDVKIVNLHESLAGESYEHLPNSIQTYSITDFAKGNPYSKVDEKNAYRIYENGIYTAYVSLQNDNSLDYIDFFNESRYRTERHIYDVSGTLRRKIFMDYSSNKARQSVYYNSIGKAYISIWQNPENSKIIRTILFHNNIVEKEFAGDNNLDIKIDWLNDLITQPSIVISDNRSTDVVLTNMQTENVYKVWRLHSGHFTDSDSSTLIGRVKHGYENMQHYDMALFLTEKQRQDIVKEVGERTNYFVIPHFHTPVKQKSNILKPIKKEDKLAVMITRFHALKRVDHTIKAFEKVVKQVPDAQLELWGTGEEKESYLELIKQLTLENNVTVKGYTTTPDEIYQKATFSLFTSAREGFGLSCLESLANGCAVISYDIDYGPSDMIKDGENGYLLPFGDIDGLADKMIYLFQHPKEAKKMGDQGAKDMKNSFSYESYKQKWLEVVDAAMKKFNS